MSVYAAGEMMLSETVFPPFSKKPLLPRVKPAFWSTFLAPAMSPVGLNVSLATGAAHAWKVGRVSPLALVIGLARPDSPSEGSRLRVTGRRVGCRTGGWLVGHLVRFGSRLSSPPAASQ